MNKDEALALALKLLKKHKLLDKGWYYCVDTDAESLDRLGQTRYDSKQIAVSDWVFTDLADEVEDTIRHEIAHAVVGPGHGHGLKWKMTAKNMGAIPRECCMDGIPQELRQKIKKSKEDTESKPSTGAYKFKDQAPVTYQMPVTISQHKVDSSYVAKQGEQLVASDEKLTLCIAKATAYCSERRAALIINFHQFVKAAIATP